MKFRPNSLSVFLMVSGSLALISGCGSKGPVSADNSASETRKRPGIEKKQQKAEPAEFSLKKRAEAFHPSYDLELITFDLAINRNITPSSSTVNFEAQLDKFLKNHQHIKFHTLQDWFERVFPKYPDTSSPYYLSLYDEQNQPISHPLDDSKILTQTELAAGIDTLIDKCNRASYSADSFDRNLVYTIKKIIHAIGQITDPTQKAQYIKDSVFYMGALGKQCNAGSFTALNLISTAIQKNGLLGHEGLNTLKDHVLYAMNAKREEVFTELCAFQGECYVSPHAFGEVQPQHACNHARRQRDPVSGARVCDILKIGCGFEETAINARLYPDLFKVLETQEVVRRFFDGKVGTEGPTAEEQRSHVGYSPENAALGLISYLNSAGVAAGVDRMLEDEFKTINAKLPDLEVEYWLSKRGNQIKVGKTYNIGLSDEEALAEFDTFSKTFNSRADFLEEIRANHLPSEYRLSKTGALKEPKVPTSFGIRQLLLMHGILIKK